MPPLRISIASSRLHNARATQISLSYISRFDETIEKTGRAQMAQDNSFDVASKVDLPELNNAIQQALKEIHTRFDLKDSKSNIVLEGKDAIVLSSVDDFKLKAVNDVFQQKLVKRGVR